VTFNGVLAELCWADAGWVPLKNIAPNALHHSKARYDAPKCGEDTRVEIVDEIMEWIQDCSAPQGLVCIGSTIAERCAKSDIHFAAYFFSSADATRNTISPIVPTIAYQIGLEHDIF
jgi:hypothetical protein